MRQTQCKSDTVILKENANAEQPEQEPQKQRQGTQIADVGCRRMVVVHVWSSAAEKTRSHSRCQRRVMHVSFVQELWTIRSPHRGEWLASIHTRDGNQAIAAERSGKR